MKILNKILKTVGAVIIAIPCLMLFPVMYVILKTFATILQPYLFARDSSKWYKSIPPGEHADYPPKFGRLFGFGPWGCGKDMY